MRTYRWMFDDNLNGLFGHRGSELINRTPLESKRPKISPGRRVRIGQQAAGVRLGNNFIEKLSKLGIK